MRHCSYRTSTTRQHRNLYVFCFLCHSCVSSSFFSFAALFRCHLHCIALALTRGPLLDVTHTHNTKHTHPPPPTPLYSHAQHTQQATLGVRVFHPACLPSLARFAIPLHIHSVRRPRTRGTVICNAEQLAAHT